MKGREAAPSSERGVLISYEWGEAAYSEFGGGVLDSVVSQVCGDKRGDKEGGQALRVCGLVLSPNPVAASRLVGGCFLWGGVGG